MFVHNYSRKAILHIDADAFFASCEQALNPAYKGKPVVTGKERNIVSAASYEAKALGVKRGVPLWEAKKKLPQLIVLPSNYETYSLFSKRMYDIIRGFTSQVEEYSIDESFADITGLRRPLHKTYPQIALAIKSKIENDLGITVSVGLSYTKVLTKIASKWNKPSGFTVISHHNIKDFLKKSALENIWGIGTQTASLLAKYNINNALQYTNMPEDWINRNMSKPYQEIWQELNGQSVYQVLPEEKDTYKNIAKTKTFTPASDNQDYVFAQLSKNTENAFIKARRYDLAAKKMAVYLKTKDFRYQGLEMKLSRPTCFPNDVMPLLSRIFKRIFNPALKYRATGVVLLGLQSRFSLQLNLFESPLKIEKLERLYHGVDELSARYGKHSVFLASSLMVHRKPDTRQKNRAHHIRGARQFINLPFLGETT